MQSETLKPKLKPKTIPERNLIASIKLDPKSLIISTEVNQLLVKFTMRGGDFNEIQKTKRAAVDADIIATTIHQCLSLRGRKLSIELPLLGGKDLSAVLPFEAVKEDGFSTFRAVFFPKFRNINEIIIVENGVMKIKKEYYFDWFRGGEDVLQLLNVPISAILAVIELFFKEIGALFTKPMSIFSDAMFNKENSYVLRILAGLAIVFIGIPLWAVAQIFNIVGNTASYLRLTIDAFCNIISSGLAAVFDLGRNAENERYNKIYPPISAGIILFLKNGLLLTLNLVIFALALLPGGQFVPALATAFAPIIEPIAGLVTAALGSFATVTQVFIATAIAAAASITMQVITGSINILFNAAKKWSASVSSDDDQKDRPTSHEAKLAAISKGRKDNSENKKKYIKKSSPSTAAVPSPSQSQSVSSPSSVGIFGSSLASPSSVLSPSSDGKNVKAFSKSGGK